MKYVVPVAAALVFVSHGALAQSSEDQCGVGRLCIPESVAAIVDAQMAYQDRAAQLRRDLELETIKADIAQERAEQAQLARTIAPPPLRPAPAPEPEPEPEEGDDEAPNESVNTNFPSFGLRGGNARYPFPPNLGIGGEPGVPAPDPFRVSGVSSGRAIVEIYGDAKIVEVGDRVPMGVVKAITFDSLVVVDGGKSRTFRVDW